MVTYQSENTIQHALEAARRCYGENLYDLVIVDNGSTDATAGLILREASWARVLLTGKNNGFGRGCNIGFAEVSSPYTIFINPDAVVGPDAVRTMLDFMERHPRAGIVGPAILQGEQADGGLQVTGPRPTPLSVLRAAAPFFDYQSVFMPIEPRSAPSRTGWVCGAVLMIRTDLMKKLQGFDPRFFLYWEEMDLCERAEALGFEVWAMGTAIARHIGGASSSPGDVRIFGCIASHYYQSRYYYMVKHHGRTAAALAEIGEFLLLAVLSLADAVRGRRPTRIAPRLQASLFSQPERAPDEH